MFRMVRKLNKLGRQKKLLMYFTLVTTWQDGKVVHCKYLPLSHTKPQESFLRLCMGQQEVLAVHDFSVLSWCIIKEKEKKKNTWTHTKRYKQIVRWKKKSNLTEPVNDKTIFVRRFVWNEKKNLRNNNPLLTEFEVRTVSYGPSFFPFDLWPKGEAHGP